jgi:predicted transcriptional regulator
MDYESKLNLLNITQLKTLIRKYSLETKIVMSKRKKADLVVDILKHTELVGDNIRVKNIPVMEQNTLNVKIVKKKVPKVKEKVPVVEVKKSNKKFLTIPDIIINYVMKFDSNKRTTRENIEILNKDLGIEGYKFEYIFSEIFKGRDEIYAEDMNDSINNLFNDLIVLIEKKMPKMDEKKEKVVMPEENYKDLDQKTIKKIESVKSKLKKLIDGR